MFQKTSSLLFIFILFTGWSSAQSLQNDMQEVIKEMDNASSVSLVIDVQVYDKRGGQKTYATRASLDKMGANSRYVVGEVTMVDTKKYQVRVDSEEKAILILDKSKKKPEKLENFDVDLKALKKALEEQQGNTPQKAIELLSENNGVRKYKVSELNDFEEMIITFDMNKKVIRSVAYQYGVKYGGQFASLNYSTFTYNKDLSEVFNMMAYFTIKNNTYVLNNKFKGYTIYTEE